MGKRLWLIGLCLLAAVLMGGCAALPAVEQQTLDAPNLRLLSMPAYRRPDAPVSAEGEEALTPIDLWLDASQTAGGVNPNEKSAYSHYNQKYREGGFHYRYGGMVGWYETVLRDMLIVGEGSRVRVLRYGNERLTDGFLMDNRLAPSDAAQDTLRSLRRDMLTMALDPLPTLFAEFSAENMRNSFYSLGTPMLNQMARLMESGTEYMENGELTDLMSDALDKQIDAFSAGKSGELDASRNDTDYPLLYAIDNLDLSRLSIITVDPCAIRRLSGVTEDNQPIRYVEDLLRKRGVFEQGLCVGLYALSLDYMGQLGSVGTADLSTPLIWGRLNYTKKTLRSTAALQMPRVLLMLAVGSPSRVRWFMDALEKRFAEDEALNGLRGSVEEALTYTADGQTVTQQPFGFESRSTLIERPAVALYTQDLRGFAMNIAPGEGESGTLNGLSLLTLYTDQDDVPQSARFTLALPEQTMDNGVSLDLSALSQPTVEVIGTLHLRSVVPNTPDARSDPAAQVIPFRDALYVFGYSEEPLPANQNPFSVERVALADGALELRLAADGRWLEAGYYRVRVTAKLTQDQIVWPVIDWIDGSGSLSATIRNDQVAAWESFADLLSTSIKNRDNIPKQFWNAWGESDQNMYRRVPVPECPPIYLAPGLNELFVQLKSAANIQTVPFIDIVFDVFVSGGVEKWEER